MKFAGKAKVIDAAQNKAETVKLKVDAAKVKVDAWYEQAKKSVKGLSFSCTRHPLEDAGAAIPIVCSTHSLRFLFVISKVLFVSLFLPFSVCTY